ncbi:putative Inositol/phosphatidylinositol phosphatase [Kockovaella imperatae]|uniref:Putative Inositol/phosphatidylinositol phosphatase n=1 Tax=Kockovaella imperatae TaxID=4999 RepID=A0A1Y1US59_9TREE|nr:putative Inositol/phosphatidylinositol phosphatase [Kockovaella imperatae]ORX40863.1 putative Inositol/phosphatidylinositol phosphatase [Kockovaella imperatae]
MSGKTFNCLPLHETLNLYISPTAYVFEPSSSLPSLAVDGPSLVNEKDTREALHIDRRTGQMSLSTDTSVPFGKDKVITCYGIIGVLSLATTDFLLIITARSPSCRLLSHPIYQATDYRLLPLSALSSSTAILNHPVERELIQLVEQGLRSASLWFSYGWDLTNTLQRQSDLEERGTGVGQWPLWKRADDGFFWNKFLAQRLIDSTEKEGVDLSRFILPIMYGFVELRSTTINNRDLLFLLICRRSRHRAGTRYFSRGLNQYGQVSNFNETEQIVLVDPLPADGEQQIRRGRVDGRERLSFVQVRGSVPVYWAEINNLRYKPDLLVMDKQETTSAMKAHLYSMINAYQRVALVNLVNHKGHELPVKEAFERNIAACAASDPMLAANVNYNYFDFHTQCKGMRFDRVSLMIDQIQTFLDDSGWFRSITPPLAPTGQSGGPTAVLGRQSGVVRSNCMDCLDRTNVAQSALGKWALNKQLRESGILSVKESVEDHPEFMSMYRNVWADHGDTVSRAYAGSGALKSDYVRTGKRSTEGMLLDGYSSLMRYFRNNFLDGDRQDAYDILTGAWVAKRGGIPPLTDTRPLLMRSMPYILGFALTMILAAIVLPRSSGMRHSAVSRTRRLLITDLSITSFLFLWVAMAMFSGSYIWGNGTSYVSWPRLNPPIEVLSYNGPGARTKVRGRGVTVANMIPALFNRSGSKRSKKPEEVELGRRKGALID